MTLAEISSAQTLAMLHVWNKKNKKKIFILVPCCQMNSERVFFFFQSFLSSCLVCAWVPLWSSAAAVMLCGAQLISPTSPESDTDSHCAQCCSWLSLSLCGTSFILVVLPTSFITYWIRGELLVSSSSRTNFHFKYIYFFILFYL